MEKIDNNEIWKPVLGYEGLYEASSLGRIRSLNYMKTGKTKVLSLGINSCGYLQLGLSKKGEKKKKFLVQRLIYSTFNGPIPPGLVVDHVNNIKTDNRLENLQLLTTAGNQRKAWLGRKHSPESRAKMSASAKARHQREKNAGKISH